MGQSSNLIYLPLERYSNRYTEYLSGANGMFAYGCQQQGLALTTIAPDDELRVVQHGPVVDYVQRSRFAFRQMETLLEMIAAGQVTSQSVIYIEDFWHPGMEMLPYACHIAGIRPKVYAFCHAQSVDPNDFTAKMLPWIRNFEIGWAQWLTGIFVAHKALKELLSKHCICDSRKIHTTGTVFFRDVLLTMFPPYGEFVSTEKRSPIVAFTSRLDKEKRPDIFTAVAKRFKGGDITFVALSGRPVPPAIANEFITAGVQIYSGVTKRYYLDALSVATVMFNSAEQDFVGYCQLDAMAMGCMPLCPRYLTFPSVFNNDTRLLYTPGSITEACLKIEQLIEERGKVHTSETVPEVYAAYGQYYEGSVKRMLEVIF